MALAEVARRPGRFVAIVLSALILMAVFSASSWASTAENIAPSDPDNPSPSSGWQAGTCEFDTPTCDVNSPDNQIFERAGGHPPVGFTQFTVKNKPSVGPEEPVASLKTVHVDLPAGLSVNPQATEQCTQAEFEATPAVSCPNAKVGESFVTGSILGTPTPVPAADVYNIEPPEGQPALFGFNLVGNNIYLKASLTWENDFHEGFTIEVPELPLGIEDLILKNRLVFDGTSGDGTFITAPTTCLGEASSSSPFERVYSTWLLASSYKEEEDPEYEFPVDAEPPLESRIPPGRSPKECDSIPFDPTINVEPNTGLTDSPAGATATVAVPEIKGGANQSSSQIRSARVSLPAGMGLNPSAANGLEACTDAQFGKGTRAPVACPDASRVGTVEVETPPLPDGSLTGSVFVGKQLSRDPASGETYRIFVDVESPRYGVSARLLGKVSADPTTGQLTTTFDDGPLGTVPLPGLPQVPFKSFRIKFNEGPKAPLTSPPICGPSVTTSQMTPWSSAPGAVPAGEEGGPSSDPPATPSGDFALANLPSGGACPKTLAERPFAPGFGTKSGNTEAGAFSEFEVDITRQDGEQELKGAAVKLPPGLTAKLAGVKYCSEGAIAAAAANSGVAEAATPTCPSSSLIGSASVLIGTGPNPISIAGKVFLAGPYKGAPLSVVVVTPATAGPFDLGSVVVRVALFVNPETTRVEAVPDAIPHVFGGALLDIRSIAMRLDRPSFSINPTNCSSFATEGALRGGGANPTDPTAFSSFPVSAPFQVKNCERLGFKPSLFLRLFGKTRRGTNPKLRAIFKARPGDANTARVAVTLPRALFLDQSNISKVCTRVQYAANDCPSNSIYGHAQAYSPLLDDPLKGPVYLRSSNNLLPDLVFSLHGQVNVDLVSRIDTLHGRIRNTFDTVPDVPVTKFAVTFPGGKDGLLTNSRALCPRGGKGKKGQGASKSKTASRGSGKAPRAVVKMKGQNGKKRNLKLKVRRPCDRGSHKAHISR